MTKGLIVLMLIGYVITIWITYEILKVSIKDALREFKAAEKKANLEEIRSQLTAKVQD